MDKETELRAQLEALDQKIKALKTKHEASDRFHDGHRKKLAELEKHAQDLQQKIKSDLHSYEEKHGHLTTLEEQLIIFTDTLED